MNPIEFFEKAEKTHEKWNNEDTGLLLEWTSLVKRAYIMRETGDGVDRIIANQILVEYLNHSKDMIEELKNWDSDIEGEEWKK
jgi:hypothetical protein